VITIPKRQRWFAAFPDLPRCCAGLTDTDIAIARLAVPLLGRGWTVEREEDYMRAVCAVISLAGGRDEGPSFSLHAAVGGIQAGMIVCDRYVGLGCFDRVESAMRAIASVLRGEHPMAA
jgi:hypothetical protein